ncbi:lantibiotic dehydratase [Mucilaginibacter flavus]|nr:lantibiotic dehydratase [Mucilaginibacter flavus]
MNITDFSEDSIKQKLNTDYVKAAIFMASIPLWEEFEKAGWDWECLNEKQKFTLFKYWNRMCFRPTPFGLFSTCYNGSWTDTTDQKTVIPSGLNNEVLLLPDFALLSYLADGLPVDEPEDLKYHLNKTLYKTNNDYRYIYNSRLPSTEPAEILSVEKNHFIEDLIAFFDRDRTGVELIDFLSGYDTEPEALLETLTDQQILYSELNANISGNFWGNRLKQYDSSALSCMLDMFHEIGYQPAQNITANIGRLLPQKEFRKLPFFRHNYYALSKSMAKISLPQSLQQPIFTALHSLNALHIEQEVAGLTLFKEKFTAKYDQKSIPLLLALDPEYGLGYNSLDADINVCSIMSELTFEQPAAQQTLKWTNVHRLLVNKLTQAKRVVELTDNDLAGITTSKSPLPPALQMVFKKVEEKLLVEEAGGANGFYLYSRFSVDNAEVQQSCQQIAQAEQSSNPDVVFAEVSFMPDEHAANINVRASFYNYEIPVLVHSVRDKEQVLDLNDLYVRVFNNEVILFSKRLNKRVIPRFNSAYNFTRSSNAIIRFLGDLQFQGVKGSLTFNFQQLIPGLGFYPRVEYKGTILSAALWTISDDDRLALASNTDAMLAKLQELNLPQYFAVVEHDNHLVFNQLSIGDMKMFLNVCKQSKKLTLKEAFVDKTEAAVVNENGDEIVNQFVVSLLNNQKVYKSPADLMLATIPAIAQRNFNPGEEWFYVKLYCHKNTANEFLTTGLTQILSRLKKQKIADEWFFVRYKDPENHLRIRIKSNQGDLILKEFNQVINTDRFKDKFGSVVLETYNRELERYKLIEEAEAVFQASSNLVLNYLTGKEREKIDLTDLQFAAVSCSALLESMAMDIDHEIHFLDEIASYFLNEGGGSKNLKVQMDKKYRLEKQNIMYAFDADLTCLDKDLSILKSTARAYFDKLAIAGYQNMEDYYSSILHMHFNRLFADDQRKKEGVIYYLVHKHKLSLIARQRAVVVQGTGRTNGF